MPIVLRPQGKLDLLGAATLQHKLERLANIGLTNHNIWIFDLSEINFINHFGLTTLVMARQMAQGKGCRLFLRNLQPQVELMLEIAELNQGFHILPDPNAAVKDEFSSFPKDMEPSGTEMLIEDNQVQFDLIAKLERILETFKHSGMKEK